MCKQKRIVSLPLVLVLFFGMFLLPVVVKAEGGLVAGDPMSGAISPIPFETSQPSIETELPCNGTRHDLATPQFYDRLGGVGQGRGIGFQAGSNFTISAVGIKGDLVDQSHTVDFYNSPNGHSAGSLISSSVGAPGGSGFGWNDLLTSFTCTAGNYYVVNWRPTTPSSTWATSLDYYHDDALPATIGPVTIVEGFEGAGAERADNFLHPYLRFCVDGSSACPLNVDLSYNNGNLNMDFTVGTVVPATWNIYLSVLDFVIPVLSIPLPVIDPPIAVPIPIPGFPSFGGVGVLTTLTTPGGGIICSDWDVVDTGPVAP